MRTSPLRPGLLVALRTSIKGNVSYITQDIEREHVLENGMSTQARWETTKTVKDQAEHERASKARSKARSIIAGVCAHSDFGLLCPLDKREAFEAAERDALAVVAEFNDSAEVSRLSFNVLTGEVMPDDARAIRAINTEMSDLMERMETGMRNLDVDVIREAANQARSVSAMLEANAQERVKNAIAIARSTARQIVKAAEEGAAEVDRAAIARIVEARTAFLDLEPSGDIGEVAQAGRAVDLEPVDDDLKALGVIGTQTRMFEV